MLVNVITVRPAVIRVGAIPEPNPRKSWWAPLFGWTSEPDYLVPAKNQPKKDVEEDTETTNNDESSRPDPSGQPAKKARTRLTEEKARRLRMLTADTMSFRDAMYHSAIASRLASDFKQRRPEPSPKLESGRIGEDDR